MTKKQSDFALGLTIYMIVRGHREEEKLKKIKNIFKVLWRWDTG